MCSTRRMPLILTTHLLVKSKSSITLHSPVYKLRNVKELGSLGLMPHCWKGSGNATGCLRSLWKQKNLDHLLEFKIIRNRLNYDIKKARCTYYEHRFATIINDPKKMWITVNDLMSRNRQVAELCWRVVHRLPDSTRPIFGESRHPMD